MEYKVIEHNSSFRPSYSHARTLTTGCANHVNVVGGTLVSICVMVRES